jgi:hypothetical protein
MASSSSSSPSGTLTAPSTKPSSHSLSPIQHVITIKLNRDNYLLWKAQIIPYVKGRNLFGFIDDTQLALPKLLPLTSDAGSQPTLNPEFTTWTSQDQMILSALISFISETILAYVVKCPTSRDVWTTLERMFTAQSRARSMSIHYQLATLRKGDSSITNYFHRFTHLIDTLAAIDQPLPHRDGNRADWDRIMGDPAPPRTSTTNTRPRPAPMVEATYPASSRESGYRALT